MKKIITSSFVIFLLLTMTFITFGQISNDNEYSTKKLSFWTKYLEYKSNLQKNILTPKPSDPSGLFKIDDNNNFTENYSNIIDVNHSNSQAPWINGVKDLVSGYVWTQSSTTYTPISGGTVLGTASNDDNTFAAIPIGFSFTYDGVAYTTVDVNANGYLKFGTISGSNYPYILSLQTNIFAAFNNDLRANNTTSVLQYLTTGSAPNRVFTIQFSNYGFYSAGWDGSDFSFQMVLNETTNTIQVVFGPFTTVVNPGAFLVQSGINTTTADFTCRTTTTDWSNTTPGGLNTSALTCTNTIKPSSGLRWTWAPPPTGIMGYYSGTTIQVQPGVPFLPGLINAQIIKVAIADTGITSPISITQFKFATTGSNNPAADILNAKLYYTGSTNTFSTTTQYGSTVPSPNGVFYVTGSQALVANATNYFWLTYDLNGGAITGDSVDAQCDSVTGTNAMGTVAPIPQAPAGSNPIDPYCLGQYSIAGCPYGLYITNVLFGSINNTTGCNGILPYCYDKYTNLSTQVRQNNPYLITVTNQNIGNPNPTAFGIWVDWNNNNSFADGGEYFPTTIIPANTTTTATATITVPAGATIGNHRMRIRTNLSTAPASGTFCSTLTYGEQEDYTVAVIADTNMTYSNSTTTQSNTSTVYTPSNNTQIIGMQVNVFGTISPMSATSFSLNTAGSTNPATDISRARIWYTGSSSVFATTTLVGTTPSPNGSFTVTGSQQLLPGANYFWLTYDVPSSAVTNDTLDAQCNSITIGGIARVPSPTSPAGFRIISGTAMSGIYTIPGSYPNFTTAIADLNARGTYGPVTFNVSSGFSDTAANLTITSTGTALKPIIFQRVGADPLPNPVIYAGVGISTTTDGIIKLVGADYITFDGIDLMENPANVTATTQMEWGYALVKPDGTNGCQNVTIKNCAITMNKANLPSVGIYSANHSPASTATFVVSTTNCASSNNTFLNNTITNSYIGISLTGYADGTVPYSFYDQNNTINQNNISNYGGAANTAYGIYDIYQNGLTINNCTINSSGGTNSTATLYGIFCSTMNNSNLTITGNTVTIVSASATSSIYAINYGNGSAGTTNTINVSNNTVTNSTYLTATSGSMYSLYCNATSSALTVSGNRIIGNTYGTAATTTGTYYGIYNLNGAINSITITNNLDSGNAVLGTTSYSVYRIYNGGATNAVTMTGNSIKNNIVGGTTATGTSYGIINGGGNYTCNISNNIVSNNSLPTTSSQSIYFIYNTGTAPAFDCNNNVVNDNTGTGSGVFYSIYYSATPGPGSTENINNNVIFNQSKTTATGTGSIYGIYKTGSGQGTVNLNNNTITGFTSAAATIFYGIYQIGSPPNVVNINSNKVGNFATGGASTVYGIYNNPTATSTVTHSQDSIYNLTSLGGAVYGMYTVNGAVINLNRNRIAGMTSSTSTAGTAYGLYIAGGVTTYAYNNIISDINAPASTSIAPAIAGMYISSGTNIHAYYNTIFLKAVSSSVTSFSTAGIYASTTPNVTLRNNVVVNTSTAGPTSGNTVAYRRSSNLLTSYGSTSNNNCFYAGTPSATNLIFYDGTNSDQTMAAYKTRVNPKDNASATENPPFVNSTTAPYDLRIQTGVGTQLESGGNVVSTPISITNDAFGTARYPNAGYPVGGFTPTAPDMGAHEFGGLNADLAAPYISYTPLGNGGTANRSFGNVIITDPSGVNTTAGTRPRCYYKRSIDSNVINDNTNITDGWKYAEATGTTSPFDFTIDYSLLIGGTGVSAGQTIQYFVIAQDLATTPNVGWNQATFTTTPSSVALVSANAPITLTGSYLIGTNTFSGSYNVGTSQTYTSLTGAAGIFAAINAGVLSGNITINITSDMVEDGTNALNAVNETGPGGYTIRIVPADATPKLISGSVAQGMIRLSGSRRVTFDGNNGLGTKYLTFRNTNGLYPTFVFINDAVRDSLKNCNIESNNASTTTTQAGTILFSTTTGLQGNDSNVVAGCDIRDRSDATGFPAYAIYNNGTTTTIPQYNSYNVITGNNIYNYFLDAASFTGGVYLNIGNTDWTITGNSFYQTATRTVTLGATFASIYNNNSANNNNNQITNNYIGGSAPLCGGSPMTYTGAAAYSFFGIQQFVSVLAPTVISGNTIKNIDMTTSPATTSSAFFKGIYAQTGWINVTGNTIGSSTGNGSIMLTTNTTTASYNPIAAIHHAGFGSVSNNTIGSITIAGNSTGAGDLYCGIYWSNSVAGQTYTLSNNLIGSLTTANSIQATNNLNTQSIRGVYLITGVVSGTNNVSNNTIANLSSSNSSTTATVSVYGIQSNAASGNYNFTGNTIRNLSNNVNVASASFLLGGIFASGSGINTFTQNTVYSLYANGAGTGSQLVGGFLCGGTTGGTCSRNKVFDFRLFGTGTLAPGPLLLGINVQSSGQYTVSNNMVTLTNDDPVYADIENMKRKEVSPVNSPVPDPIKPAGIIKELQGTAIDNFTEILKSSGPVNAAAGLNDENHVPEILKNKNNEVKNNGESTINCSIAGVYASSTSPGPCNYYYNTFYIGGTQPSGSYSSWAFLKTSTGAVSFRNNLFVNARTGGGNQYVIGNENANPLNGWTSTSSNYNSFIGSNANTIGEWGLGNPQSIDQWVTSTGGDKQSWSTTTSVIPPASLLAGISTGDLTVLSGNAAAWIVSGKGIALAGQNIDFTGDARVTTIAGGCTDIGADEFAAAPPSNPVATQVGAPAPGGTSKYVLYGRTLCSIDWGTGGTSYPASLNVNYYSGINPTPAITAPNRNSNSYWVVTPASGTLTGTTYSITLNFGENETYNIASPPTNTLLAKYGTFWQVFPDGSGDQFSLRDWSNFTLTTSGLNTFSTFALSDAALPSIELVSPPHNSTVGASSTLLVWKRSAGSTSHRVVLATDSTFATGIIKDTVTADTTKAISGLVLNSSYWWRVYGTNAVGTGAYSQIFKFTYTLSLTPPPPPVLSSPPNNATGQPVSLSLVWFKAPTATSYRIQLATDSTFTTGIVINDSTMTDSIRTVSGLSYLTNYWWRVNAKNAAGTSSYSTVFKFTTMPLPPAVVTLKVIPGGFYNTSTGRLNMRDTIKAMLIDSTGCLRSDSTRAVLDSVTFTASISFSNAATGNYFLYVFHRNHIFISAKYEQSIIRGSTVSYDFTNDSTKTFGSNVIRVSSAPLLYGMIPGDANRDGYVDGFDQTIWINQNGLDGYLSADFNGDLFVDGFDQTLWVLWNGQSYAVPCELTFESAYDHAQRVKAIYNDQLEKITNPAQNRK